MSKQKKFDYLKLPTDELLEKFGEGSHVPGSGSAAAFSGLLGIELLKTVCKLTISRTEEKYVKVRREVEIMLEQIEKSREVLVNLFQEDAECFNQVSILRVQRDKAVKKADKKAADKISRQETELMKKATEIPLKIAQECISLIDFGFSVFEIGFQSARGDSGVAVSNLLSAVSGSLFVTFLNIRTRRTSNWTQKLREDAERIGQSYNTRQKIALTKVLELYKEGITTEDYQIKLDFD